MTSLPPPDDPLIPAGPTMAELRDASVEAMLAPFRARLDDIAAEVAREATALSPDELADLLGQAGVTEEEFASFLALAAEGSSR